MYLHFYQLYKHYKYSLLLIFSFSHCLIWGNKRIHFRETISGDKFTGGHCHSLACMGRRYKVIFYLIWKLKALWSSHSCGSCSSSQPTHPVTPAALIMPSALFSGPFQSSAPHSRCPSLSHQQLCQGPLFLAYPILCRPNHLLTLGSIFYLPRLYVHYQQKE